MAPVKEGLVPGKLHHTTRRPLQLNGLHPNKQALVRESGVGESGPWGKVKKTTRANQTLELTIGLHGGHSVVKGKRKVGERISAPFFGSISRGSEREGIRIVCAQMRDRTYYSLSRKAHERGCGLIWVGCKDIIMKKCWMGNAATEMEMMDDLTAFMTE